MQAISAFQAQKLSPPFISPSPGCLSLEAVESINQAYDRVKSRGAEYRVPRMILHKIDDIKTDLNLRDSSFMGHVYPTADLAGFVQMMVNAGSKDAVETLKALWTGKLRRRKKAKKDGLDEDSRTDGRTSEDEDSVQSIFPNWGRRHMKGYVLLMMFLRAYADSHDSFDFGLGRSKKPTVEVATGAASHKSLSADEALPPLRNVLPSVVISG